MRHDSRSRCTPDDDDIDQCHRQSGRSPLDAEPNRGCAARRLRASGGRRPRGANTEPRRRKPHARVIRQRSWRAARTRPCRRFSAACGRFGQAMARRARPPA
ncbi:hypothetical protein EYA88_15025 [Burkholderia pseudomallei]|nr:hypothetical protein EYA88_15025 [Burkholderia pseudomallei]